MKLLDNIAMADTGHVHWAGDSDITSAVEPHMSRALSEAHSLWGVAEGC
jgi:hypothetical protein